MMTFLSLYSSAKLEFSSLGSNGKALQPVLYRIILLLIFLSSGFGNYTFGQYSETFSSPNKGIIAGPCGGTAVTCAANDFTGVNWDINGDLSGIDTEGLFTTGGVLVYSDVDVEVCWESPVLDITAVIGNFSVSVDMVWTGFDSDDYINVEYNIDGGGWTQVPNVVGGGAGTIQYGISNQSGSTTVNQTGLSGTSTLSVRVCGDINLPAPSEQFTADNVSVPQAGVVVQGSTSFTAPENLCIDAGVQTGLSGGTPAGGVYSGDGVTNNASNGTYDFNPATAGAGTTTITYTQGGSSAMDDVTVFTSPSVSITGSTDLCVGETTMLSPTTGGTWTSSDDNVATVTDGGVVTAQAEGTATFTFTDGSTTCQATTGAVTVKSDAEWLVGYSASGTSVLTDIGEAEFNNLFGGSKIMRRICESCSASHDTIYYKRLTDIIAFNPYNAFLFSWQQTDNTLNTNFKLYSSLSDLTNDENEWAVCNYVNNVGFPRDCGSSGFVPNQWNLANSPIGQSIYKFEIFQGALFTAPDDLCSNAGIQSDLTGGLPMGGVYSGPGVSDDGNGMTYDFDPAAAGAGVKTITYTFTYTNGCSGTVTATDDVEVFSTPTAAFTAPADLCVNAGVQNNLGGGTPTGGLYSGDGVTDDGNGMTFDFDPAVAGVGTHTITYTVGQAGCDDSAMDDVEVLALPTVTFTAPADLCVDDAVQTGLGGGTPVQGTLTGDQGVYSGPGVTDDGNGMTYSFDPSVATGSGAGTHTITYTYTDENGCTSSASDDIEVAATCSCFMGDNMFTGATDSDWNDASNWSEGCVPASPYVGNLTIMIDVNTMSLGTVDFELTGDLIVEDGATFDHNNGMDFDVIGNISVLSGGMLKNISPLSTSGGLTNAGTYSGVGIAGDFVNNGTIKIGGEDCPGGWSGPDCDICNVQCPQGEFLDTESCECIELP